jgi:uncharacterized membrane protein
MIPIEAHLALNHVPLVGLAFGLVFLMVGLTRSSEAALALGFRTFVAIGIVVLPVAVSGLVSEKVLAGATWLDADIMSTHRLAGIMTLVVLVALGALSAAVLVVFRRVPSIPRWTQTTVLLLAIAGFAMSAWTAYLGGSLRHTELGRGHPPAEKGC